MKKGPKSIDSIELPLDLKISFKKVMDIYSKYTSEEYKDHPYYLAAHEMKSRYESIPEFEDGFSDLNYI